tara:strand:- start:24060 stop:29234 length:5175 start_codon:yes stop_codon:yes gene_type:complete
MVTQINPKPNTFYRVKELDDDIGIYPVYGDAYVGMTSNFDIKSSPDSTYYLGESTVITENEIAYGAGALSECYLNFYVNKIDQLHTQTSPWVDTYSLKGNIDLTEGNLVLASGTSGPLSLYSSTYDMSIPWIVEDFDGVNKYFADNPTRFTTGWTQMQTTSLQILHKDYYDAVFKTNESYDDEDEYDWDSPIDNIFEELGQGADWVGSELAGFGQWVNNGLIAVMSNPIGAFAVGVAVTAATTSIPLGVGVMMYGHQRAKGAQETQSSTLNLTKHKDGLYYLVTPAEGETKKLEGWVANALKGSRQEGHTREWWMERGAWADTQVSIGSAGAAAQYSTFDETFVAQLDQYNSIFSQVYRRGMARDIKAETVGDQGDNTKFLAYVNSHIVSDDTASDGNAWNAKLFWENYSGATSGSEAITSANYFGWNSAKPAGGDYASDKGTKHPMTQSIYGEIKNIPQPTMYDITTPSLSSSACPEIEIVFKINSMPTAPYVYSGTSFTADRARELSRSFNMLLNLAPLVSSAAGDVHITENLADTGIQTTANFNKTISITFCKMNQGNDIDVLGILQDTTIDAQVASGNCYFVRDDYNASALQIGSEDIGTNGVWLHTPPGSDEATNDGLDIYHTKIPEGEWVTMRVKLWTQNNIGFGAPGGGDIRPYGSVKSYDGSNICAYFPELHDEDGNIKSIQVYNTDPVGPSGLWPAHMTLWANNMRAINAVPGESDPTHINNLYTKVDDVPDDDKIVDILVDRISYYGWGSKTNNCTVNLENDMGGLIKMPNSKLVPVNAAVSGAANNTVNVETYSGTESTLVATPVSGGANYYGGFNHAAASYLSFGFSADNFTDAVTQANHQFLFNDFSVALPVNAQAIPYWKAGYFTSGNYTCWDGDTTPGGNYLKSRGPPDWFYNSGNTMTVGMAATDNVRIGGLPNYVDGFKQKGMIGVSGAFSGSGGPWVRSGNPYVASKILTVSSDGTSITVDKATLFNCPLDDRFVIEMWGAQANVTETKGGTPLYRGAGYNQADWEAGSGTKGYVRPLVQTKPRKGNTIYLSDSILYDDAGLTDASGVDKPLGKATTSFNDLDGYSVLNNDARIIISPYKYWMNLAYVNVVETSSGTNAAQYFSNISLGNNYANDGSYMHDQDFEMLGGDGTGCVLNARVFSYSFGGVQTTPVLINYVVSGGTGFKVGNVLTFSGTGSDPWDTTPATTTVLGLFDPSGWGAWYNNISGGTSTPLQPRVYNTVIAASGGSTLGTTFNETLFNDGVYSNRWSLNITNPDGNVINNTTDYSFGVIEAPEEGESLPSLELGGGLGYIQRDFLLSGQNYINLTNYIRVSNPKMGDDFNFMVVPTYMTTRASYYNLNVDTKEGTYPAQLIYGLKDRPPKITDFRVQPTVDLLNEDVNIYNATKGAATDIKFTWEEIADDMWYRLLYVDTATIQNKYHKINFWAPLDATGSGRLPLSSGTSAYKYYDSSSDRTGTALEQLISGTVTADVTGFRGYGSKFVLSGSLSASSSATSHGVAGLDEFTVTAHGVPSTPGSNGEQVMIWQTSGALPILSLRTTSGTNKMRVSLMDEDASATSITGTTSFDCDGVQPLAAVVTFNKNRTYDNVKLYVNGMLEATSGNDWTTGKAVRASPSDSTIYLGSQSGSAGFWNGFLEEITIHTKEFYVPVNEGEYTLDTVMLPDTAGSTTANYNARVFGIDFHNIRGRGPTDVCRGNTAGWHIGGV